MRSILLRSNTTKEKLRLVASHTKIPKKVTTGTKFYQWARQEDGDIPG